MNINDMGIEELRQAVHELRRYPTEVERLQAIVDNLPKDADDDPVEDCRSYFFPCSNGAIEFIAYLGPQCSGDSPTPYPWGKAHKTRKAAERRGRSNASPQNN